MSELLAPTAPDRPTALIVEDDRDSREGYAEFLSASGFDVIVAADGAEALGAAVTAAPDVILLDLHLPRLSGYDIARLLKAGRSTRDVPVIAISASVSEGDRHKADQAGCDSFLAKPCLPDAVLDEVTRLLRRRDG